MKNTGRGHPWLTGDERKKAMKKVYSKPDIYYEDFSLSTNIAAGCELKPTNSVEGCGAMWGHSIIFTESMGNCNSKVAEGKNTFDNICYHVPYDTFNVFNS